MLIPISAEHIQKRISEAARRAGRNPETVILMAVSKTVEPARIRQAHAAVIRVFSENRVREFADKAFALKDLHGVERHRIGHLQSNKIRKTVEFYRAVDCVDSLRLAQKLEQTEQEAGRIPPVPR